MDPSEIPVRPNCRGRKSVSFTDETELVDANGTVTVIAASDDSKDTALSHKPSTPPLSAALGSFVDPMSQTEDPAAAASAVESVPANNDAAADNDAANNDAANNDAANNDAADDAAPAADAAPADAGLDLSMMKKKKKKVKKVNDEFTAKLKELELDGQEGDAAAAAAADDTGDMHEGTGVWGHDETRPLSYDLLVSRFYVLLNQKHPTSMTGVKSKIPPPQCMREGNKKTIFANIADICKRMKRNEDHVTAYLFAELGTNGSVDASRRLIIKGKFTQKHIEGVLRNYIVEYVTCKTCRSLDTELSKGENRLYFMTCQSCGSRRSVTTVKAGFTAQVGRRKKLG